MSRPYQVTFASFPTDDTWYDLSFFYLESVARKKLLGRSDVRFRSIRHPVWLPTNARELPSTWWTRVMASILEDPPDLLCLTSYFYNIDMLLQLGQVVKQLLPETRIVMGGHECTPDNTYILENARGIDALAYGEGENTFLALLDVVLGGGWDLSSVGSLAWRPDPAGPFVRNRHNSPLIMDLETIPSTIVGPYATQVVQGRAIVSMETVRGCPFLCSYCNYPRERQAIRRFPLERILEEIDVVFDAKVPHLYLMDATFHADKKRAADILEHCARRQTGHTELHIETRSESLDREDAALMRAAGVQVVEIGVQSTNPATLKAIMRHNNPRLMRRGFDALREAGFHPTVQIIADLPLHDYPTLLKSVTDTLEMWPDSLEQLQMEIFQLLMLPGAPLRNKAAELGMTYVDFPPYFILGSGPRGPLESRRMVDLVAVLNMGSPIYEGAARLLGTRPGASFHEWMDRLFLHLHDDPAGWPKLRAAMDKGDAPAVWDAMERAVLALASPELDEAERALLVDYLAFLKRRARVREQCRARIAKDEHAKTRPVEITADDVRARLHTSELRVPGGLQLARVRRDFVEWDVASSPGGWTTSDATDLVVFHLTPDGRNAYSVVPKRAVAIVKAVARHPGTTADHVRRLAKLLGARTNERTPHRRIREDLAQLVNLNLLEIHDVQSEAVFA